ncbi:MAG: anthrone oxygenase family protein [Vicinamibacterales bacterium]
MDAFVWLGSIAAVVLTLGLGLGWTGAIDTVLPVAGATLCLCGVQLPTFRVNVPLNNALQRQDLGADVISPVNGFERCTIP